VDDDCVDHFGRSAELLMIKSSVRRIEI
jgi:hypothetical protein